MSVRETVLALYDAYGARDFERTKSFVSDDFCWDVPIKAGNAPYGQRCLGPDAMMQRMKDLDAAFHYLDVQPKEFLVDGDQAAVRVTFTLQSKSGGEPFDVDCCHFWHVSGDKCTKVTEVYDTGLMP